MTTVFFLNKKNIVSEMVSMTADLQLKQPPKQVNKEGQYSICSVELLQRRTSLYSFETENYEDGQGTTASIHKSLLENPLHLVGQRGLDRKALDSHANKFGKWIPDQKMEVGRPKKYRVLAVNKTT